MITQQKSVAELFNTQLNFSNANSKSTSNLNSISNSKLTPILNSNSNSNTNSNTYLISNSIKNPQIYIPPELSTIKIYYQNIRGLRSKQKQFYCNSSSFGYSIIVLTETWLNSSFYSSEYFNSSFIVYRTDREVTGSIQQLGGGTLIAVTKSLVSSSLKLNGFDDIEHTAAKIILSPNIHLIIYAAYIPPSSPAQTYNKHLDAIKSISLRQSDCLLIMGDFNIPHAEWIPYDDRLEGSITHLLPINVTPPFAADFILDILAIGLHQINTILNCMDRLLDLIFFNVDLISEISNPRPLSRVDNYHPPALLVFEYKPIKTQNLEPTRCLNFTRGDYIGLSNFLNDANIVDNIISKTLDEKVDFLQKLLRQGIS